MTTPRSGAQAVERALAMPRCVAAADDGLGVTELAQRITELAQRVVAVGL